MTCTIDIIFLILMIICIYNIITETKKEKNTKKVTSYERIVLVSVYEDLNSTIADNEDAWGDYV